MAKSERRQRKEQEARDRAAQRGAGAHLQRRLLSDRLRQAIINNAPLESPSR
jgi:hypothetical protein